MKVQIDVMSVGIALIVLSVSACTATPVKPGGHQGEDTAQERGAFFVPQVEKVPEFGLKKRVHPIPLRGSAVKNPHSGWHVKRNGLVRS